MPATSVISLTLMLRNKTVLGGGLGSLSAFYCCVVCVDITADVRVHAVYCNEREELRIFYTKFRLMFQYHL